MRKFKNLTRATAVLVWTAGIAGAGIVYDNGGPVGVTGNGFSIASPTRVADDFTVLNSTVITGVGFYFQNTAGITGWNQDVTCAFRNDASNAPGSMLQSGQGLNVTATDSGLPWCCLGGNAFAVSFDLQNPFSATGGTRYWLELSGATGGPAAYWITAPGNATPKGYSNGINQTDYQFAFYLTDTSQAQTPEPTTGSLIGLACLGMAVIATKRGQKSV